MFLFLNWGLYWDGLVVGYEVTIAGAMTVRGLPNCVASVETATGIQTDNVCSNEGADEGREPEEGEEARGTRNSVRQSTNSVQGNYSRRRVGPDIGPCHNSSLADVESGPDSLIGTVVHPSTNGLSRLTIA